MPTSLICVPGNSALTILAQLGKNTKVPSGTPCLIETAALNNLPQGFSVNHCLVHPKGSVVPVILINQNNYSISIQQPLLAADIYWVEHLPWDYGGEFHISSTGKSIEVAFQPLPLADIMATVNTVHNEPDTKHQTKPTKNLTPTFGPCPNTDVADFDFQKEVKHLLLSST